jgi:hypothetical protein
MFNGKIRIQRVQNNPHLIPFRHGIEKVMDLALEYLGDETPIHVSYDIDSLDPEWAPSTGFPVSPGCRLMRESISRAGFMLLGILLRWIWWR